MSTGSSDLSNKTPFGIAAGLIVARLRDEMFASLPGTLSGEDVEALHDMRVASRRLRAALRVFAPCFPPKRLKRATESVGRVTRALGQVRDQDVLLDFLRQYNNGRPPVERVDWIVERELQIREGARMQMIDSLREIEQDGLADRITALIPRATTTRSCRKLPRSETYAGRAAATVRRRLKTLKDLAPVLCDEADIDGLHRMRIAAKRLRYTMEAFVPCFGEPLSDRVAEMKRLQEPLGQIHDCDVWLEKLGAYQNEPGLADSRLAALDALILERRAFRGRAYQVAVSQWNRMKAGKFGQSVRRIAVA